MPFISTEEVARKRNELKKEFPNYKFSVTRNNSTINVVVIESPIELRIKHTDSDEQVNVFWIEDTYKEYPEILKVLQKIYSIINDKNGVLVEDGDYGTVPNFYTSISIGSFDKPFSVVTKKVRKTRTKKVEIIVPEIKVDDVICEKLNIQIVDYSEKSFAIIGDTKPIKDLLKVLGGRFNFKLSCGAGWIFPITKKNEVLTKINYTI
jgi:hypothetical protein